MQDTSRREVSRAHRRQRALRFSWLSVLIVCYGVRADGGGKDVAEVVSEIYENAVRFDKAVGRVQVDWHSTPAGDGPIAKSLEGRGRRERSYRALDGREKLRRVREKPTYSEGVQIKGDGWSVDLVRKSATADFYVASTPLDDHALTAFQRERRGIVSAPYLLGQDRLVEVVRQKSFEVANVSTVRERAGEFTKVEFRYRNPAKGTIEVRTSGWFTVDPRNHFALVRSNVIFELRSKGKVVELVESTAVEYGPPGDYPVPVRMRHERGGKDPTKPTEQWTTDVTRWTFEPPPASEFELKTYGLEDLPKQSGGASRAVKYGAFASGVVLVGLGLLVRKRGGAGAVR